MRLAGNMYSGISARRNKRFECVKKMIVAKIRDILLILVFYQVVQRKNSRQDDGEIFCRGWSDRSSRVILSLFFGSFGFFEKFFEITFSVTRGVWIHPVDTEIFGNIVFLQIVIFDYNHLVEYPVQKDQEHYDAKTYSNLFSQLLFFAKVEKKLFCPIFLPKLYALPLPYC